MSKPNSKSKAVKAWGLKDDKGNILWSCKSKQNAIGMNYYHKDLCKIVRVEIREIENGKT